MHNTQKIAFKRIVSNICAGALPIRTKVVILDSNNPELGYSIVEDTKKGQKATIFLNPSHSMLNGLTPGKAYVICLGVAIHEMLHVYYTNFSQMVKAIQNMEPAKRGIFKTFFNLDEDVNIEEHVSEFCGGDGILSLQEARKFTFEQSPDIDEANNPVAQIICALCQYGDQFQVKGNFMSDEVRDDFLYMAELTDEAIAARTCVERIEIAKKQADYIFNKYARNYSMPDNNDLRSCTGEGHDEISDGNPGSQKKREKTKKKIRSQSQQPDNSEEDNSAGNQSGNESEEQFSGDEPDEGNPGNETGTGSGSNSNNAQNGSGGGSSGEDGDESDGETDNSQNNGSDNSRNTSDGEDESSETSGNSGHGTEEGNSDNGNGNGDEDGDEDEDDDADDGGLTPEQEAELEKKFEEEIMQRIEDAEDQIKQEMVPGSKSTFKILEDPESKYGTITEMPITEESIDSYQDYDEKYDITLRGRRLSSALLPIFKSKPKGKIAAQSGKLSLKRVASGKVTPYLFDRMPKEGVEAAVELLIDQSGSMYGENIEEAKAMACEIAVCFDKLGIKFAICGHSAEDRRYNGDDMNFRIYKDFDSHSWQNVSTMETYSCNHDGTAIRTGLDLIRKRREANKIYLIITDGLSHDENSCASAVREAKKYATTIGISLLVSDEDQARMAKMYGIRNCIFCERVEDLNPLLTAKLKELCKDW